MAKRAKSLRRPGALGRNATLIRTLRLARRLHGVHRSPRLAVLADELNVTTRTIRRDIDALEVAGWPLPPDIVQRRARVSGLTTEGEQR